jgi:hypothetical protein
VPSPCPRDQHVGPKLTYMLGQNSPAEPLGPWPGFGLMCLFIAAAMAAAFLLLARRDT